MSLSVGKLRQHNRSFSFFGIISMKALLQVLRRLRRRLWRERRRVLVCAALLALSDYLLFCALAPELLLTVVPFLRALISVGVLVLVLSLVTCIAPGLRTSVEVYSVVAVGSASVSFIDPSFRFSLAYLASHPLALIAVLIAFVAAAQIYDGQVFRFPRIKGPAFRFSGTSRLSASVLWDGLAGSPAHPDRLADRDAVIAFEPLEPGSPHLRTVWRHGDSAVIEEHRFVELCDPPHSLRFRWQALNAAPDIGHDTGRSELRIIDAGRKRRVVGTTSVQAYTANLVLRAWLDDHFGRELDRKLDLLERHTDSAPPATATNAPA